MAGRRRTDDGLAWEGRSSEGVIVWLHLCSLRLYAQSTIMHATSPSGCALGCEGPVLSACCGCAKQGHRNATSTAERTYGDGCTEDSPEQRHGQLKLVTQCTRRLVGRIRCVRGRPAGCVEHARAFELLHGAVLALCDVMYEDIWGQGPIVWTDRVKGSTWMLQACTVL